MHGNSNILIQRYSFTCWLTTILNINLCNYSHSLVLYSTQNFYVISHDLQIQIPEFKAGNVTAATLLYITVTLGSLELCNYIHDQWVWKCCMRFEFETDFVTSNRKKILFFFPVLIINSMKQSRSREVPYFTALQDSLPCTQQSCRQPNDSSPHYPIIFI